MNINWRTELPLWAIIAALFVASIVIWPSAPSRVPVHFDASGHVSRYGGKAEGLLLPPALALGVYLLMLVLPRIDPRRANYALFSGPYLVIRYVVVLVVAAIHTAALLSIKGVEFNMSRVVLAVIGVLFIVVGNILGKVRPNWFVGVRTPWTLSSNRSWVRTHRLAGWLFTLAGLVFLVLIAVNISRLLPVIVTVVILGIAAVLVVYSYIEWRHDPQKSPPNGTPSK